MRRKTAFRQAQRAACQSASGALSLSKGAALTRINEPTDVTNDQWAAIEPIVTTSSPKGGRSTEIDLRAIVHALIYRNRTGVNGARFSQMLRQEVIMPKEKLEQQVLEKFEEIARKYNYHVFSGQGNDNRIPVSGNAYFQFGDLRVDTKTHHIVVEVESAGGITNLVKYWYCQENQPGIVKKPIVLLHIFRQVSEADYGSHLALWDFVWGKMSSALGAKIKATRYLYRDLADLDRATQEFEKHLKRNPMSDSG